LTARLAVFAEDARPAPTVGTGTDSRGEPLAPAGVRSTGAAAPAGAVSGRSHFPNERASVSPQASLRLKAGFSLAWAKLERRSACQALFVSLGSDGHELLSRTLYYGASRGEEESACRSAFAITQVGSPVTRICSRFARASTERAALVVIHEALHLAGLGESPQTPGAMSSSEINDRIADRCGL
jgi:hypothetical protein